MMTEKLVPLGRIVHVQVQREKIKTGDGISERYTPDPYLTRVDALRIDPGGVTGITIDGKSIADVHHRDHPRSRFRGANGISLLTTAHYAKMRDRFGTHMFDGIAGESMLVDSGIVLESGDLAGGIVVGEGNDAISIPQWSVAHPCAPFSRYATQFPDDARPDRRLTEALQFLDNGTRGFYGIIPEEHSGTEIRTGAMVYLVQH